MRKCNICGHLIAQDMESCPECGNPMPRSQDESGKTENPPEPVLFESPKPESAPADKPISAVNATPYLVWSILNVVFCCMPLGIAGIIYANKAGKAATSEEGQKHLGTARIICILATVTGFILSLIYIAVKMQ